MCEVYTAQLYIIVLLLQYLILLLPFLPLLLFLSLLLLITRAPEVLMPRCDITYQYYKEYLFAKSVYEP